MPDPLVDGSVKLKVRSVPNVPTLRLRLRQAYLHNMFHTTEGIHEFDGPRRQMIDNGMIIVAIRSELEKRGERSINQWCKHCATS